ncbi:MAG: ABC transporter substrate-binding protein [Lachnospiraceae bacterium]
MMRQRGKRWTGLLLTVLLTGMMTGCATRDVPQVETKQEEPIDIGIYEDISGLDVAESKDMWAENVARCIFSTLFAYDEEMNVVPLLAKDYQQLSNLEWEFKLHEGVKFHDGGDLTARDVVFSLQRAQQHEKKDAALDVIVGLEAVDNTTIRMTTSVPTNLPDTLVRISSSIMSEKAMAKPGYDPEAPVGSGPFQLLERVPGKIIRLERFDNYFLEPAKTKHLNFVVDKSESNRTASLLNGTLDVLFQVDTLDCDALRLNSEIAVYQQDSTKMEVLQLNSGKKPLDDIRVRQAIAHAIDKQKLVDKLLDGYGVPLYSALPTTLMGAIDNDEVTYDVELAKELLTQAGYPNGFSIGMVNYDEQRKKEMEYIKLDLAQVGITMDYEIMEREPYLQKLMSGTNEITATSWTCNADPYSVFSQLYGKAGFIAVNHTGYTDPEVEELIEQARAERDPQRREVLYCRANEIVTASGVYVPLFQPQILVAANKTVQGVRTNAQGLFGYESLCIS